MGPSVIFADNHGVRDGKFAVKPAIFHSQNNIHSK